MIKIKVTERDLKVNYTIDNLTCDQIAENYNKTYGSNITGDVIEGLIKSYGIQKRNVRRSTIEPNYTIVTDNQTEFQATMELSEVPDEIVGLDNRKTSVVLDN